MDGQDWAPVVIRKSGGGRTHMSEADKERAIRAGNAVSERKFAAGENKSVHSAPAGVGVNRKLDEDHDTYGAPQVVSTELRMAIQQARTAKGLKQLDLARLIAEKPTVINEFESGRAVPNGAMIAKLERALGVRLPRPPKK